MCLITAAAVGGSTAAMVVANAALAASAVGAVASAGIGIAGAQESAAAAEEQAKYEYEVSKYEAEVERQAGELEQLKHGIASRRAYGMAIARASKFGSDLSFGSTQAQFTELRRFQAFEQSTIKRNADTAVLGATLRGREALTRGQNAKVGATYASIGQAFSGVASLGSVGLGAFSVGAFGGAETVPDVQVAGGGSSSAGRLTSGQRVRLTG